MPVLLLVILDTLWMSSARMLRSFKAAIRNARPIYFLEITKLYLLVDLSCAPHLPFAIFCLWLSFSHQIIMAFGFLLTNGNIVPSIWIQMCTSHSSSPFLWYPFKCYLYHQCQVVYVAITSFGISIPYLWFFLCQLYLIVLIFEITSSNLSIEGDGKPGKSVYLSLTLFQIYSCFFCPSQPFAAKPRFNQLVKF